MNLIKDLAGGVLVILAAGLIGIAQNAARDDSVPLVPKKANAVAANPSSDSSYDVSSENIDTASIDASPVPTDAEIAEGRVSKERLSSLLDAGIIVLVDARSHEEFDAGHIAGAISFPYDELLGHYDDLREKIPVNADVVIYCESVTCDQSESLATELGLMGYERVVVYKGGWQEWTAAGLPTETSGNDKTEH